MTNRPMSQETAIARQQSRPSLRLWIGASLLGLGAVLAAAEAKSDGHETVIESHGFNEYGELKYPIDFPHLDYVNPDAPLGGEISVSAQGTFDSMNPYATLSGTPGVLSSTIWESSLTATSDEVGSSYCLLCTTIEYPEDKSWVIFNMRDDVVFSDGTPMTVDDIVFSIELFMEQGTPSAQANP